MENKILKISFITVDSFNSEEMIRKVEKSGIYVFKDGFSCRLYNITPEKIPVFLIDIPLDMIEDIPQKIMELNPPIVQEAIPTRNGCCEWVSSKTLLEIVKTLVNGNSKGNDHPNDERTR